jgi:hypothetical protein
MLVHFSDLQHLHHAQWMIQNLYMLHTKHVKPVLTKQLPWPSGLSYTLLVPPDLVLCICIHHHKLWLRLLGTQSQSLLPRLVALCQGDLQAYMLTFMLGLNNPEGALSHTAARARPGLTWSLLLTTMSGLMGLLSTSSFTLMPSRYCLRMDLRAGGRRGSRDH